MVTTGEKRVFKVIAICGSMRFYAGMLTVAEMLTKQGNIVLMPFAVKEEGEDEISEMLDEMHRVKIRLADEVVIVTNQEIYVGESTANEIRHATTMQVPVSVLIPDLWN